MAKKVGIVAVAQTKFEKSKPMLSRGELIYEVIEKIAALHNILLLIRNFEIIASIFFKFHLLGIFSRKINIKPNPG